NQSLDRLMNELETHDATLIDALELRPKIERLEEVSKPLRKTRNRSIAHKDWGLRSRPLSGTTKAQIDEALGLIQQIMNAVQFRFEHSTTVYGYGGIPGDAKAVVAALQRLGRVDDARLEALGVRLPWSEEAESSPAIADDSVLELLSDPVEGFEVERLL